MTGFTMSITNCLVQIMYNASLQKFGGDLYVGVMTIVNSVREVVSMPVSGITNSAQPVMGYNYGAREYGRVKKEMCIRDSNTWEYPSSWAFTWDAKDAA